MQRKRYCTPSLTAPDMTKRNQNNKGVRPPLNGSVLPSPRKTLVQYRNVGARSVVDPIVGALSSVSRTPYMASTSSTGISAGKFILSPLGVNGIKTDGTTATLEPPHLPWLSSTAANFLSYRVTRAVLVVVGNQSAQATGQMSIASSPDCVDVLTAVTSVGDLVTGGVQFPIADLATGNRRIPLRIDSTWKKVSSRATVVVSGNVVQNASMDDLVFTGFQWSVTGGPVSVDLCSFFVEYDVEFKGVAGIGLNA